MKQPSTQTVFDLFNGRIQFIVPVYQRAYVWTEQENWSLLWDDIVDTLERYSSSPHDTSGQHFLGPLVLEQQHSEPGGVDPRLVIDGQQRLTTLQIILAAAVDVAMTCGADDVAAELKDLMFNRGRVAGGDLRFKMWPSRRDRAAFLQVMEMTQPPAVAEGIPGAWTYFRERIEEWVTEEGKATPDERTQRIRTLQTCLDSLLYFVAINLDESDNAQVIFETLNARGTGLGALDLVKNATFLQAERETGPVEALHDEHWEPTFETDDYWLEETRQGREKRGRADWFLMHWLAMELGTVVRSDKLFDTFRREILRGSSPVPMSTLVPTLCEDARIMRSFDDFVPGTQEALFFSRLDALDTTTMLPIALLLFRSTELTEERRRRAIAAIESWLVRRAIVRLTTKNYNRTIAGLLKVIRDDVANADVAIIRELRSSPADTAVWPTDEQVRIRLQQGDLYNYVKPQSRVRMLLEACELDVRDPAKTEAIPLPGGLSIEHALPQSWEDHWPLPDGEDPDRLREERDAHVHRLGNLTLVTQPLNSSLSNAPWLAAHPGGPSKREELARRSVLLINQHLCQNDAWDEALIDQRGAELTERVLRSWPGPDSLSWGVDNAADEERQEAHEAGSSPQDHAHS